MLLLKCFCNAITLFYGHANKARCCCWLGCTIFLHIPIAIHRKCEVMIDHDQRIYAQNFSSCKIRAWKKFKPERDSNQRPLRYRCSVLRPTELSSQLGAGHVTSSQLAKRLSRNYLRRNGGNVIVDNTGTLRTNIPRSPLFRFWAFIYPLACNCILHLLRVYYELSTWPAPSCLDSSR